MKPSSPTTPAHDRLLDAAERIVARDGVNNLTLAAVASEAKVSKGGLLYHFPSKQTLIVAVVERLACQCEGDHDKSLDGDTESAGRFTRAYMQARLTPPKPSDVPIHTALLAAAGTDPHYLDPFRKRSEAWQKRLQSDQISPVTATIVQLAIDGLCLGRMLGMPVPSGKLYRDVIAELAALTREDHPPNPPAGRSAKRSAVAAR